MEQKATLDKKNSKVNKKKEEKKDTNSFFCPLGRESQGSHVIRVELPIYSSYLCFQTTEVSQMDLQGDILHFPVERVTPGLCIENLHIMSMNKHHFEDFRIIAVTLLLEV